MSVMTAQAPAGRWGGTCRHPGRPGDGKPMCSDCPRRNGAPAADLDGMRARAMGRRQMREASAMLAQVAAPAQVAVRAEAAVTSAQGERAEIDGAKLLRDVREFLRHFALWPSEAALTLATLWAAQSHARDPQTRLPVWEYAAKLLITAGDYGSGKSWIAKLTGMFCPDTAILLEPTKPSLIDVIAENATVIVTEVDELFASAGRNRGIIAVINASYEPGRTHTRKSAGKVEKVPLFGFMILDGVDAIMKATRPDLRAVVSRCLVIRVEMAPDGYRRPRMTAEAKAAAAAGNALLGQWVSGLVADGLAGSIPDMPEGVGSPRRYSLWEPLFAVALAADQGDPAGYWSTACREACEQIEKGVPAQEDEPQPSAPEQARPRVNFHDAIAHITGASALADLFEDDE